MKNKKEIDRKAQVKICLDEIEASFIRLQNKRLGEKALSKHRGWIRRHKEILKELKYKGKMPRQPKKQEECDNWQSARLESGWG